VDHFRWEFSHAIMAASLQLCPNVCLSARIAFLRGSKIVLVHPLNPKEVRKVNRVNAARCQQGTGATGHAIKKIGALENPRCNSRSEKRR
jgi:hypothetical protein